jgi:SOS-response transcriptional repressor LexA
VQKKIADYFDVEIEYLYDGKTTSRLIEFDTEHLRRIPLIGRAAAGDPMLAIENPG